MYIITRFNQFLFGSNLSKCILCYSLIKKSIDPFKHTYIIYVHETPDTPLFALNPNILLPHK